MERVATETVEAKERLLDQLHAVKVDRDAMQAGWQEMKSTAEQAIQVCGDTNETLLQLCFLGRYLDLGGGGGILTLTPNRNTGS